jgi:hypothetical protein
LRRGIVGLLCSDHAQPPHEIPDSPEAACAEALTAGVHSADVILNILSRRREPDPMPTILTPDTLRLRHLPLADCARYDRLRRAS